MECIEAGRLGRGGAEQGLIVEPAARHNGETAGGLRPDGDVIFALLGSQYRVEDGARAGFGSGLLVDLDEQQPVEQQVYFGAGDGAFAEQGTRGQAVLAVAARMVSARDRSPGEFTAATGTTPVMPSQGVPRFPDSRSQS
jgi:hypothetical protein